MTLDIRDGSAALVMVPTGQSFPLVAHGAVHEVRDGGLLLRLDEDAAIRPGERAVVEIVGEGGLSRVTGDILRRILRRDGILLDVRLVHTSGGDARDNTRVSGALALRYQVCRRADDTARWMDGENIEGTEHEPAPLLNFSASGVAFGDRSGAALGDTLLVRLAIPGDAQPEWRCTARVVREWTVPGEAVARIAVRLDALPTSASAALARYTARLQEAVLERICEAGLPS